MGNYSFQQIEVATKQLCNDYIHFSCKSQVYVVSVVPVISLLTLNTSCNSEGAVDNKELLNLFKWLRKNSAKTDSSFSTIVSFYSSFIVLSSPVFSSIFCSPSYFLTTASSLFDFLRVICSKGVSSFIPSNGKLYFFLSMSVWWGA